MVLLVSDLETCENPDIHARSSNNDDENKIGHISSKKKRFHPRTEEDNGDAQDKTELARKTKMKKKKNISEADPTSLSDHSCFVALVTASNLAKDALFLPLDFTTSNGFRRECRKIVLRDEADAQRSWRLKLRFKKSSGTFYLKQGWRCFCSENGRKAGGFFMFTLVRNGEIPVLSFGSTESGNDNRRQRECLEEASGREKPMLIKRSSEAEKNMEKEESIENECSSLEKQKNLRVTLTITRYSFRNSRLRLPIRFTRENNISKPGMITLLGKGGVKYQTLLLLHSGAMVLGNGLKGFLKENGLKRGDSFTLELISKDTNHVLSLCSVAKATIKKESLRVESDKEERKKNLMERGDSTSPSQNRLMTLTLTHDKVRKCRLRLPLIFVRENGITRPGMMTLLDKDGTKRMANLLRDCDGKMSLGKGLKEFVKENGLKIGESFTLELIWEKETPMLRLLNTTVSTTSGSRTQQGESLKASEKESVLTEEPSGVKKAREAKNNKEERRDDSSSVIQNRSVTFTLTAENAKAGRLDLPSEFMKANNINKLGKITFFGKRRMKSFDGFLLGNGLVTLGCDWKSFCEANGVKIGESFTLEFIHEQDTGFVFKFCSNPGD